MYLSPLPSAHVFSPSAHRLRFAIDRFLAGKLTPMQLQSWCFAHFEQPQPDEHERQFWRLTLLNLAVFHRCDFHRTTLERSLTMLVAAIDATGIPCATPLTTSECWHEMTRRERLNTVPVDRKSTNALGDQPCQ